MTIHRDPSPLADQRVKIISGRLAGAEMVVEDWWDRIAGKSWMVCNGNPACLAYAWGERHDPTDDEVIYGKIGGFGHLVHVSRVEAAA